MILRFEVREAVRLDALLPFARPPSIDLEVLTSGQPTFCFSDADIEKKLILQQDFSGKFFHSFLLCVYGRWQLLLSKL